MNYAIRHKISVERKYTPEIKGPIGTAHYRTFIEVRPQEYLGIIILIHLREVKLG